MSDAEVNRLLAAAEAVRQRGRSEEAGEHQQAVVQSAPDPQALNSLGLRVMASGDIKGAAELLAQAAAADPGEPALWLNLADAQRRLGDDKGQSASLDRVLSLDPRHVVARILRAQLNERLGASVAANHDYAAVVELAKSIEQPTPALQQVLAHARAYVAAQFDRLGSILAEDLAPAREGLSPDELRRFDACVEHQLGRRQIFANRCFGLHFPFLPADEFLPRHHFPWLDQLEAETDAIRSEFEALVRDAASDFRPYIANSPGAPKDKWAKLDHSLDWSAYFLWKDGVRREAECARCPATAAVLDKLPMAIVPGRAPTAFFSILRPDSRIPPHTGVTNTRTIIHLALIVPEGCGFRVGGEVREWKAGKAFAFDDTIEHEAWNESDQLRALLIFDVPNPHMTETERELVNAFYRATDAAGWVPLPGPV